MSSFADRDSIEGQFERAMRLSPELIAPSARVDLLSFLLKLKKCLRTQLNPSINPQPLTNWAKQYDYQCIIDHENFIYIAYNKITLERLFEIDHSQKPCTQELGGLLDYPPCCCMRIAELGEEGIDSYDEHLAREGFHGEFELINSSLYWSGESFICHVPCSTRCLASLQIAKRFAHHIRQHPDFSLYQPWRSRALMDNL